MPASHISLDAAKKDKLFYFLANAVVYRRSDGRCLILKRHEREIAHPSKYGVVGGKLEWVNLDPARPSRVNGEVLDFEGAVEDLLAREAQEEANIQIGRDLKYINSMAYIRPDGVPAVMVKFAVEYVGGEVVPEAGSFTDYAWVNADEVKEYDCIEGIPGEVVRAIELLA